MIKQLSSFRHAVAIAASGALFGATALPAHAAEVESKPTKVEQRADQRASAPGQAGTKYCFTEAYTGTRLARKICHTKQQWSDRGVDIAVK